ncbi:MAG TPA: helix-turn-helix domain-containing protein [Clostridiales bacterium]|nr:helix-turn-helix domain-containing protein [Clostridiales bacterium]
MNLDFVTKLCKMISAGYQVVAAFYDIDGEVKALSHNLQGEHLHCYLEDTKHVVRQCLEEKEIHISISEIAVTIIALPIIDGDILRGCIAVGPFYSYRLSEKILIDEIDKMDADDTGKMLFLHYRNDIPCYSYDEYIRIIRLANSYLYDAEVNEKSIRIASKAKIEKIPSLEEESSSGFPGVEEHGSYQYERYLWECIRIGATDKLKELLYSGVKVNMGLLCSGNELRNMKNLYIVGIALASRAAMDGGLNSEVAYSLADIFIRQIESMSRSVDQGIVEHMFYEFANRVKEVSRIRSYSPYVNQCSEYIKAHANENISVAVIADHLGISHTYLSRIFKQETGIAVVDYIKKVKVKEAKFLLKYTDLSLVEISTKLSYSSQSHFNAVFKEAMSITPKQYRDKVKITK